MIEILKPEVDGSWLRRLPVRKIYPPPEYPTKYPEWATCVNTWSPVSRIEEELE